MDLLVDLVLVAAAVPATLLAVLVRRRLLQRGGGTVDCSLRLRSGRPGRGWALGVGRFTAERLRWYPVFSLSPLPRRRYERRALTVVRQRPPSPQESVGMLAGSVVVECTEGGQGRPVDLALPRDGLTALLAWLESTPPGAEPRRWQ